MKRTSDKLIVCVGFAFFLGVVFLIFASMAYKFDSVHNRGWTFGYYGQFNRVTYALNSLDDISISRAWFNDDVTLEEFGFTVRRKNGDFIYIGFDQDDPRRNLSGDSLIAAVKSEINTAEQGAAANP